MKIRELEALLGDEYARMCLIPAYSKDYLLIARMNNAKVSAKRLKAVRERINQHVKELNRLSESLSVVNDSI